jgi:hypothetical protein
MHLTRNARWVLAVVCVGISLAACDHWPPVINNKEDILRLSVSTKSIRARALHDADFASLSHLPELRDLDLLGGYAVCPANFSDAGLAVLASLQLPHLENLYFGHCTNVTDASLVYVIKLKTVATLGFVACPGITDVGLQRLVDMPNLLDLDLRGCTNITDKGLKYLTAKTNFRRIALEGCTQVTFEAVTKLRQRFPNADIKRDDQEWSYEQ